jgi:SAM-dependent methyltransferase
MCEVLEHLNFNPLPLLKEINRIGKPGSIFYLSLPNFARMKNRTSILRGEGVGIEVHSLFTQLDPRNPEIANGHWREYTAPEIREILERLGYRLENHYYFSVGETVQARGPRAKLGQLLYKTFPTLKENQTAIAIRDKRTELVFDIPSTVHRELRQL